MRDQPVRRKTLLTMDVKELRDEVRKLRKERLRLRLRLDQAKQSPERYIAEGNNGGSYVQLQNAWDGTGKLKEGMVFLEVGESCVRTIDMEISVAALACILTQVKDTGFQTVLVQYLGGPGARGCPPIVLDRDPTQSRMGPDGTDKNRPVRKWQDLARTEERPANDSETTQGPCRHV